MSDSLVHGIDVSNYQPTDLTELIRRYNATHVVVRLSTETQSRKDHARKQFQSALDNQCTVSGYVWSYFELDPEIHTREAMQVAEGYPITQLWFDCEQPPRVNNLDYWLSTAVKYAEEHLPKGIEAGVYTGRFWWEANKGSEAFGRLLLWVANWDESPDLHSPLFGGWTKISGKQWTSTNETMDRDVFDPVIFEELPSPTLKEKIRSEILPEFDRLKAKLDKILSEY